ncbi:histidinol dehydrogenase [Salicibibacter halophilus]|uniref:Histidinol dehydrogenase n=1 Tax=Salicibibacter halophilus TaxID=2502791 RepID=A0A514LJ31_9BACI|nr:histidinol dehydrogenase [Salicibibacter halophilus]QDI91869.1 histidinol dehydrogenase [Salicibibacter halophilus]
MKIIQVDEQVSLRRDPDSGNEKIQAIVDEIIAEVRKDGDEALRAYTKKLDGAALDALFVSEKERAQAYESMDTRTVDAIRQAIANIRDFHERQRSESWMTTKENGTILGQQITPLDAVGVYVPGGKAAYPSTILMDVIPAQVANVGRIVMASPPDESGLLHPAVLVAASELGVETILKAGGAQAVAALAYGTDSVQAVDKIVGPGNSFVALAKRAVFGQVDIDMIAGPSEIVVLADDSARPDYVAADLLSQAEHEERATAIVVTPSKALAEKVSAEVERQLEDLPRAAIAREALDTFGAIYLSADLNEAVDVVNSLAPEHVEVLCSQPFQYLGKIRHAGAIFLGENSAESVGDYFAGPNHVLPTNGTARFSSPLTVDDFLKKSSIIHYSEEALAQNSEMIASLARVEGFEAHARAVEIRKKKDVR